MMNVIEQLLVLPEQKDSRDFLRADGIWDFLPETPGQKEEAIPFESDTIKYQSKYQSETSARSYNVGYRDRKKNRTRKEITILRNLLRGREKGIVLDMPSGGGRMSPVIADTATAIIEMDIALGQLMYGKASSSLTVPQTWVRASGFQIPLGDNSVTGCVCIRLSHHLHSMEEKKMLLGELLRVAKHYVIFSFVDGGSLKYTLRKLRSRLTGSSMKKNSMEIEDVQDIASRFRGKLLACPAIGPFQAHRYALIEKTSS